ncbi:hypothetical protein DFH07DRAFT_749142 [Mycena maculata]|uniref:Uncharacterized protein n=1 Tax=Mycena maculata TaxID=230809 RepID=A0AAD7N582_9AGAR|nr:hypothetical protein DFH07DRAFT_749142 [Mycena maculata]
MINTALTYRRALHEITLDSDYGLTSQYLFADEWAILSDLRDILLAFKDATLYFSRDSATIATVIPAMDKLDSMLATAIIMKHDGEQKTFTPAVKIALVYAKKTLNRYYAKAYYNRVQRICLILHPRYKTGYLRDNDWDEEDIESAKQDVRDVYESYCEFWQEILQAQSERNSSEPDGTASKVRHSVSLAGQ